MVWYIHPSLPNLQPLRHSRKTSIAVQMHKAPTFPQRCKHPFLPPAARTEGRDAPISPTPILMLMLVPTSIKKCHRESYQSLSFEPTLFSRILILLLQALLIQRIPRRNSNLTAIAPVPCQLPSHRHPHRLASAPGRLARGMQTPDRASAVAAGLAVDGEAVATDTLLGAASCWDV